jgi:hypothetical protein
MRQQNLGKAHSMYNNFGLTSPPATSPSGEKFNIKFTGETPKVSDLEIQSLIKKYPPPPNIEKIKQKILNE